MQGMSSATVTRLASCSWITAVARGTKVCNQHDRVSHVITVLKTSGEGVMLTQNLRTHKSDNHMTLQVPPIPLHLALPHLAKARSGFGLRGASLTMTGARGHHRFASVPENFSTSNDGFHSISIRPPPKSARLPRRFASFSLTAGLPTHGHATHRHSLSDPQSASRHLAFGGTKQKMAAVERAALPSIGSGR